MKVHAPGHWLAAAFFVLFILWQLGDAVFNGRMIDFLDEDETYLFFFENPFLFIFQFLVLAGLGCAIAYTGSKQFRKDRKEKADTTPRHTYDARKSSKPPRKGRKARKAPRIPG